MNSSHDFEPDPAIIRARRAALVVAHPGHELRIHGWLERMRPIVFVLTDGSGSSGRSRLTSTTRLLEQTGATPGSIYGVVSDRDLYELILGGKTAWFVELAYTLREALIAAQVEIVAADAREGFNPAHDLCRLVVDAALSSARSVGRHMVSLAFPLDAPPAGPMVELPPECIRLELSDEALTRKLAAAHAYEGLDQEVGAALAAYGSEAFRNEVFWPAHVEAFDSNRLPVYERFGEERIRAGTYREVIRRHVHIDPIADALRQFAEATGDVGVGCSILTCDEMPQ